MLLPALRSEGISHGPLKIVEVCNARYANEALQKDINVALMLPCPIVVYTEAGETLISTMRASALTAFCPDSDLDQIAATIEKAVRQIIDQSASFSVPSIAERKASIRQSDEICSTRVGNRIPIGRHFS